MKRELVIISAVLVPFALLVAAGFYFSDSAEVSVTTNVRLERANEESRGEGKTVVDAPVLAPHPDPLPKGEGTMGRPPEPLPEPLQPLLSEVKRCFADQRLKSRHEVKVRFTPTRDGGFADVQVDEQNPYLQACLEDVFAELSWQPDGGQTFAPASHTFSFDPAAD